MKIIMGMLTLGILAGGPGTAIGGEINTLLEVDITNLNEVKITATDAFPEVSSSGSRVFHGVRLENFFSTNILFQASALGDLSPTGSSVAYNHAESPGSENYLNIYRKGIWEQSFDSSERAFQGVLELNLAGQPIAQPGAVGRISVEDGLDSVIGQWAIIDSRPERASRAARAVPEPGSAALLALGLAAITCRRQR